MKTRIKTVLKVGFAVLIVAGSTLSSSYSATTGATTVVEFYNTNLANYFITADSSEAVAIDNGSAGPGWKRTGDSFQAGGGTTPVCRFYGSQSPGPNSHFYTADPGECAYLKQLQASTPVTAKRWNYEAIAFNSTAAANQGCPAGATSIYRAYNNGFARGIDSNHRISNRLAAIQEVVAKGWTNEGVVMCTLPLQVMKSSYENKIVAGNALGPQVIPAPPNNCPCLAYAFADFFRDGSYSIVTHTQENVLGDPSRMETHGHIHFWKMINGKWADHTPTLLADTVGCVHPRKALVADFNGDGLPDVFFACHGVDAAPFQGEQQHVLLSQPNGTYNNVTLPFSCYCHGGSAADVNGNGFADLVLSDTSVLYHPFYLVNNKDGTFTQDAARVPNTLATYSIELIDFGHRGRYDLWVAGAYDPSGLYSVSPTVFHNPGNNDFRNASATTLPVSREKSVVLDIVIVNNNFYLLLVDFGYKAGSIEKVVYPTLEMSTVYSYNTKFNNGWPWLNLIIPFNGNIVSEDASYGVSVPQ